MVIAVSRISCENISWRLSFSSTSIQTPFSACSELRFILMMMNRDRRMWTMCSKQSLFIYGGCIFISAERFYADFVNAEINSQSAEDTPQFNAERLAEDLLCGDSLSCEKYECNPDAIREAIDVLKERSFNIMVLSDNKYDEDVQFELKLDSCALEYTERKMPNKWIRLWYNPKI